MRSHHIRLTVTTELPTDLGNIPLSPVVDFGKVIAQANLQGVLDPNSIRVVDPANGAVMPHHLTEDFAYADRGRIEFVVKDPSHRVYDLQFDVCPKRPPLAPQERVPLVGVGDLLRYNAPTPGPVTMYSMRLVDLTGNGRPDLCGTWNYYHRPGSPISGAVCFPRIGDAGDLLVADMQRLCYREQGDSEKLHDFPGIYVDADFADLDGDGRVDMVFTERGTGELTFFLHSGESSPTGLPVFVRDRTIETPKLDLGNLCIADLDGDGALDLVLEGNWIRNQNPSGWPFEPAKSVDLGAGPRLAFLDLDDDGQLELLSLEPTSSRWSDRPEQPGAYPGGTVTWRRRLPGSEVGFGPPLPVAGIPASATRIATAVGAEGPVLLVRHAEYREIGLYALAVIDGETARFENLASARSPSAVVALTDQSWPCQSDWDGDGIQDLLVGSGYGWPHILRNSGTNEAPVLGLPELIAAGEVPIRILRDDLLHSHHPHNMGYPYPSFVDWDGDGLPDLMLPNETNRIVWHRNVGTPQEPRFGPRQLLEVDGYPDSEDVRAASGRLGEDGNLPNYPYPHDPASPFHWRTGAAFADWNGDGLMDFITHDEERKATLFVQYIDSLGERRLRKEGHLKLTDGREIDDSIVGRDKHWTESFRPVDWDGNGLLDLLYNTAGTGHIYLLRNAGTAAKPVFDLPRELKCYGAPMAFTIHGPNAWPGDWDGDGKPDLLGCVEWSVYPFFAHAALEMERHPEYDVGPLQ